MRVDQMRLLVVERYVQAFTLPGKKRNALVDCYFMKPSRELGIASEVLDIVPGFQESVLEQVVGVLMVFDHASYLPVQGLLVEGNHLAECGTALGRVAQPGY